MFDGTTMSRSMRDVTSTPWSARAIFVTMPIFVPSITTFARSGRLSTLENSITMSYPPLELLPGTGIASTLSDAHDERANPQAIAAHVSRALLFISAGPPLRRTAKAQHPPHVVAH